MCIITCTLYLVWQDGQHYTVQSFEIEIRDEQNFPPRFVSSLSGTIQEDMRAVSTAVLNLSRLLSIAVRYENIQNFKLGKQFYKCDR